MILTFLQGIGSNKKFEGEDFLPLDRAPRYGSPCTVAAPSSTPRSSNQDRDYGSHELGSSLSMSQDLEAGLLGSMKQW